MVEEPDRPPKTHDAGGVRVGAGTGAATGRDERRSRSRKRVPTVESQFPPRSPFMVAAVVG
jgi:hypothetical protein